MSVRDTLIAYLEPILADTAGLESIKMVKSVRATDKLSKPIIIVKTLRWQKLPEAPIGNMMGDFLLTLVSNLVNVEKAEDQLDDMLEILLPLLFSKGVVWTDATQTQYDQEHISYDIAVSNILK